jgi:uncharacterized protein HemY
MKGSRRKGLILPEWSARRRTSCRQSNSRRWGTAANVLEKAIYVRRSASDPKFAASTLPMVGKGARKRSAGCRRRTRCVRSNRDR